MAVAVVLEFKGGTLDQYDQLIEKMGFEPGGKGEPGGLFHWVTKTDDGLRVTDVWEDAATFQKFADEKIGPLSQDIGAPAPTSVTMFEVHNYLTAG